MASFSATVTHVHTQKTLTAKKTHLLLTTPMFKPFKHTYFITGKLQQLQQNPFNGPLSGTTWVSHYQKGKSNLDFTEARDSG